MTILARFDGFTVNLLSGVALAALTGDRQDGRSPEEVYWDNVRAQNARTIDEALGAQAGHGLLHVDGADAPRKDAAESAGFYTARQLEYVFQRTLERPRQPMSAYQLFAMDPEVPFGARTFTQRIEDHVGRAEIIRSPSQSPGKVEAVAYEQEQKVHYMGIVVEHDIFSDASDRFAGTAKLSRLMRGGRDALERLGNEIFWKGHEDIDVWGVLNHPFLAKKVMDVTFVRGGSANDMLAELHALCDYPAEASGGALRPNKLAVSRRVYNILSQTRVTVGSDNTPVSVRERFIEESADIEDVVIADELKDAGGSGVDGFLAYRDDENGIALVMPAGPTMLPAQRQMYGSVIPMFAAIGGVKTPYVGNNILGLGTVTG